MPEFALLHRLALAGAKSGTFGPKPAALTLTALPEGRIVQVLAAPGSPDLGPDLRAIEPAPFAVRAAGPGQWLIVGGTATAADLEARLASAACVDQSHGRVALALAGHAVEAALAKGTGVDAARAAYPIGLSVLTLIGHVSVHLTRVGDERFEILVMRSFALSLWDELIDMGLEHGIAAAT